jgi:hypothetical protein
MYLDRSTHLLRNVKPHAARQHLPQLPISSRTSPTTSQPILLLLQLLLVTCPRRLHLLQLLLYLLLLAQRRLH